MSYGGFGRGRGRGVPSIADLIEEYLAGPDFMVFMQSFGGARFAGFGRGHGIDAQYDWRHPDYGEFTAQVRLHVDFGSQYDQNLVPRHVADLREVATQTPSGLAPPEQAPPAPLGAPSATNQACPSPGSPR